MNTYAYADNDPVQGWDPSGEFTLHWGIKWRHPWRDIGHYGGPIAAFAAITAAELLTGGTLSSALFAAEETVGATAAGSAFSAAAENIVSGGSFRASFMRDFNFSSWFLAASVALSPLPAFGGYAGAGAKTPLSCYVATNKGLGGLTLGSSTLFDGVDPGDIADPGVSFLQHEFGHTVQFALMSASGHNPWLAYLGLGVSGMNIFTDHVPKALCVGCAWERMASILGGAVWP